MEWRWANDQTWREAPDISLDRAGAPALTVGARFFGDTGASWTLTIPGVLNHFPLTERTVNRLLRLRDRELGTRPIFLGVDAAARDPTVAAAIDAGSAADPAADPEVVAIEIPAPVETPFPSTPYFPPRPGRPPPLSGPSFWSPPRAPPTFHPPTPEPAFIHKDETGELWSFTFPDFRAPLVMVLVENSTPEADGSRAKYWLRVRPTVQTAREAVASTFGLTAPQYTPAKQT
jgi:hypothetical protein